MSREATTSMVLSFWCWTYILSFYMHAIIFILAVKVLSRVCLVDNFSIVFFKNKISMKTINSTFAAIILNVHRPSFVLDYDFVQLTILQLPTATKQVHCAKKMDAVFARYFLFLVLCWVYL